MALEACYACDSVETMVGEFFSCILGCALLCDEHLRNFILELAEVQVLIVKNLKDNHIRVACDETVVYVRHAL